MKPLTYAILALAGLPGATSAQQESAATPPGSVLDWMKINQDTASPQQDLLADTIRGVSAQTFNNSLAAMAFLLEGENERARRILDFYAGHVDSSNSDPCRQSFFLNGEARGFYQNMAVRDGKDGPRGAAIWNGDRWMGDNAWLYFACAQYDHRLATDRYESLRGLIVDLMDSWFIPVGEGGYIGSGWRNFDQSLHEKDGHEEGNIDAYAVFTLAGRKARADQIALWLLPRLSGNGRPLDHVTWRVMGIGGDPWWVENAPGYRKTVSYRGREVTGFSAFPSAEPLLWSEGLGHVACAYAAIGETERSDFYTAEYQKLIFPTKVDGKPYETIPFTTSRGKGYEWVDPEEGFTSACAWYIMARHRFNPMRLEPSPATETPAPAQ